MSQEYLFDNREITSYVSKVEVYHDGYPTGILYLKGHLKTPMIKDILQNYAKKRLEVDLTIQRKQDCFFDGTIKLHNSYMVQYTENGVITKIDFDIIEWRV